MYSNYYKMCQLELENILVNPPPNVEISYNLDCYLDSNGKYHYGCLDRLGQE